MRTLATGLVLTLLVSGGDTLRAGEIPFPNASFELPATSFVSTQVDAWQKTPKPGWYEETGGYLWEQLTGVFKNPLPSDPSHLDNCHGEQAIWLFAVPEVGLYQDLVNLAPPHPPNAVFEAGKSYRLTVGVLGGKGNMLVGVRLGLSLYYRDDASNRVAVAATTITNAPNLFTNGQHFEDFGVEVPPVRAGDPWAGRPIGVQLLSLVGFDLQGGFWDLDHVRLVSSGPPQLADVHWTDGQVHFTLLSEPGKRCEILASANVALPASNWTIIRTVTNLTGTAPVSEPADAHPRRFYQARQLE